MYEFNSFNKIRRIREETHERLLKHSRYFCTEPQSYDEIISKLLDFDENNKKKEDDYFLDR